MKIKFTAYCTHCGGRIFRDKDVEGRDYYNCLNCARPATKEQVEIIKKLEAWRNARAVTTSTFASG